MTRIAVASDDGDGIAVHTGRCRSFIIYEVEPPAVRRLETRSNPLAGRHEGAGHEATHRGAGNRQHLSHGDLVEALADCAVLVTGGLGPRLTQDLAARRVEALVTDARNADKAVALFAAGRLTAAASAGCGHTE